MSEPARDATARWDIGKRWTEAIASDGFTPVPAAFLEHYAALGISSSEAMFLIHLLSHKWDKNNPFPGFARIAARMGMTETAVRGHARKLEKRNLLKRILRPGKSNEFDLKPLFQKLEEQRLKSPRKIRSDITTQ